MPYHTGGASSLPGPRQSLTLLLTYSVTKQDIEEHFGTHGAGSIKEIKLMNGFGFIEYEDAMDARDVVPGICSCPTPVKSVTDACITAFRMKPVPTLTSPRPT